jgi:hypothetical protein
MKKLLAILALCLIFIGMGYGYGVLTGDHSFTILTISIVALIPSIFVIGGIYFLIEYIRKN